MGARVRRRSERERPLNPVASESLVAEPVEEGEHLVIRVVARDKVLDVLPHREVARVPEALSLSQKEGCTTPSRTPIIIGSGGTVKNIGTLLPHADGVIVGTSIKRDGILWNPVDPQRAEAFIKAAKG